MTPPKQSLAAAVREAETRLAQMRRALDDVNQGRIMLLGRCAQCHRVTASEGHWRAYCSHLCQQVHGGKGS